MLIAWPCGNSMLYPAVKPVLSAGIARRCCCLDETKNPAELAVRSTGGLLIRRKNATRSAAQSPARKSYKEKTVFF